MLQLYIPLEATATNATTLRAMAFDMRNLARTVLGFIPILGDTADLEQPSFRPSRRLGTAALVEQAYNKLKGQPVDIFLATIATVGLALDTAGIVTAGTTVVAAGYFKYLKHIYKASKVKGVLGAVATVLSKILDDLLLQKLRPSALFEKIKTQTSYLLTIWKKGGFALLQAVDKFVKKFTGPNCLSTTAALPVSVCAEVIKVLQDVAIVVKQTLIDAKSIYSVREFINAARSLCGVSGFKAVWERFIAGINNSDKGELIGMLHEIVHAYRAKIKMKATITAMGQMVTKSGFSQEIDIIVKISDKRKIFMESKSFSSKFKADQTERYIRVGHPEHEIGFMSPKNSRTICQPKGPYEQVQSIIKKLQQEDSKAYANIVYNFYDPQGKIIECSK